MTEREWFELDQEYYAVFSSNIPRAMLPADEESAVALVREAIGKRDESVFERGISTDAAI